MRGRSRLVRCRPGCLAGFLLRDGISVGGVKGANFVPLFLLSKCLQRRVVAQHLREFTSMGQNAPRMLEYVPLVAAAVALAAAAYSARSWPIGVRSRVKAVEERIEAAEANVDAGIRKLAALTAENAEFLEAAEGVLQAVETKRRRIAARDSAQKAREPETPEERRAQLKQLARERGIAV